jgi:hypothetical protein
MTDNVIDFYDNASGYTPLCCRPGGRCTTGHRESPDVPLSEDEHKLSEFINNEARSMREVLDYWHSLKTGAAATQANEIPTHFVGFCDECRTVKSFTSERARDLWSRHHAHDDGDGA